MKERIPIAAYCEKKVETIEKDANCLIDYVDISSVDNCEKRITTFKTIESAIAPSRAKQLIKKNDVLVSTVRPNLNAVAVVNEETENLMVASTGYCVLRCNSNTDYRYLFNFCQSQYFIDDMVSQATGASYPAVSSSIVKSSLIPNYPIEEQRKIADEIDTVSDLIYNKNEQIKLLDELVKSRFIEMFGNVVNSPKYSGIPLGTICSTLSGGTPTTKIPEYYQGDIPWISTPYLGNNHINGNTAKAYITEDAIKNSATHLIPANTIMFGIRVGVGKSSIIDEPMCANQDTVALMGIDTEKYNLLFIKHTLDGYQSHFDSIKKGATILGITTDDLKKVLIPDVDIKLQNQFADFVEQTDKLKLAAQKILNELETLKKSLMQKYFG